MLKGIGAYGQRVIGGSQITDGNATVGSNHTSSRTNEWGADNPTCFKPAQRYSNRNVLPFGKSGPNGH